MKYTLGQASIRLLVLTVIVLTAGSTVGQGALLQPTTTLPPPAGVYTFPVVCITPVCLVNANVAGFQITSVAFSAGNELVSTDATFSALVFANSGGSPGAPLGALSTMGTVDFTYFGRSSTTQLGSFASEITDFEFIGTFNSRPFHIRNNPLQPSLGQTTIHEVSDGLYQVSSFFDVFAELSLDNGAFVPGPPRHIVLTAIPEPGSAGLAVLGFLGLAAIATRIRKRIH
jgi:hypothetical protein